MTTARKHLVSIADTPYYHITARCVRRAFLCGIDSDTKKNYEHRRQWIEERIRLLSSLFTIDIAAYAIMSNHYHIVVRLSPEQADDWSSEEVLDRWLSLHRGSLLIQQQRQGFALSKAEEETVADTIAVYKERLTSLSWFMKTLNQTIAREANKEDNCKGHFFEARYTSQALKTEESLLACMAYVDLNPVRAEKAETPEVSEHTSIKERIKPSFDVDKAIENTATQGLIRDFKQSLKPLMPFVGNITEKENPGIPFHFEDYLSLVDWTGRAVRDDKKGAIDASLPPILERLNSTSERWITLSGQFEKIYSQYFRRRRCSAA